MDRGRAGLAAYQRVAETIKQDVQEGRRAPGDQLPGNRQLAEDFGVSLGTAQKALQVLQSEGWVFTTPAVGVFIADRQQAEDTLTLDVVRTQLDELRRTTAELSARLERLEHGGKLP